MNREQLVQLYGTASHAVNEIRTKYAGKAGEMSADEEEQLGKAMDDALDARSKIEKIDQFEAAEKAMRQVSGPAIMGGGKQKSAGLQNFETYLRTGSNAILERNIQETLETRSNNTQYGQIGGYVVGTDTLNEIIKPDQYPIFMRGISRVQQISALVAVPTLTSRPTAYWQGEVAEATESNEVMGQRGFMPNRLTIKSAQSRLLVQMGVIDVAASLMQDIDYQRRAKEETAFLQGTGQGQPLGVFTASASGIPTSRDVATVGAAIAADDIFNTYYNLVATYRQRASWVGSRAFVKTIAKLKDTTGQYIWSLAPQIPNTLVGAPPSGMLLGRPLYESEFAPDALTAGTYASVFGDFGHFRIFDFLTLGIETIMGDPYASRAEIGYVCHAFMDGNVDLIEAFARLQVKS